MVAQALEMRYLPIEINNVTDIYIYPIGCKPALPRILRYNLLSGVKKIGKSTIFDRSLPGYPNLAFIGLMIYLI